VTTGRKNDDQKPDYSLLPPAVLHDVVLAFGEGNAKYGRTNYLHVADGENRYYAAALRHLEAWRMGEHIDPDSGEPHLSRAIASVMILEHRRLTGGERPVQAAVRSGRTVCRHGVFNDVPCIECVQLKELEDEILDSARKDMEDSQ